MVDLHLLLEDAQYRYLKQRAQDLGTTVEAVIADLIAADVAWQQALATDPVARLFGQIQDTLEPQDIDAILYGRVN
jgi:hypothetical protein